MQIRLLRRGTQLLRDGAVLAALLWSAHAAHASTEYLSRPDVRSFIEALQAEHGLDPAELERVLGEAQYQPSVVRLLGPDRSQSAQGVRSYAAYRTRFLTNSRILAGTQYWEMYDAQLRRAEAEFGVPAEVILGIIGVETAFGQNTGSFRVVDALATIAFDGPRRQEYFRDELKELLLLARELSIDPLALKGSYAGAIGLPQFMPSSYRRYAVDFDGDGVVDLAGSAADAIGSVANYYRSFGWKTGAPVVVSAESGEAELGTLLAGGIRPHVKIGELRSRGLVIGEPVPDDAEATVFFVQLENGPKLLLGLNNFYVITRYNRSINYAMAVHELAREIKASFRAR